MDALRASLPFERLRDVEHLWDFESTTSLRQLREIQQAQAPKPTPVFRIHPYLFAGLGSRPWTTYRVEDGYAYVDRWFGGPKFMPLTKASIECDESLTARLGFGNVKIVAESGAVQEWAKVPNLRRAYDVLLTESRREAKRHEVAG
jgi:hypothetical protein